jgi:hypothetical protein
VSADDYAGVRPGQHLVESRGGGELGDDLVVAAGGAVAEQCRPEAVDAERQRFGERREEVPLGLRDLLCGPFVATGPDVFVADRFSLRRRPVVGLDELVVGVSANEPCSSSQGEEAFECLSRHRTGRGDVAADNDQVWGMPRDVAQDRFESGEVSVNVVEGCDSHRRPQHL